MRYTDALRYSARPFFLAPMSRFVLLVALLAAAPALAQTPQPIADAKALAIGTTVTVAGRVTVANEYGGPMYLQDATGGMPVYFVALHTAAQRGDSVIVTGPLSEFQATTGQPGSGLKQISCPTGNTTCVTYTVVGAGTAPTPRLVRFADFAEPLEAQLLVVEDVRFATTGSFQANTSYTVTDGAGGTGIVYIDNTTNLVGAAIPTTPVRAVGTLGQYRGARQLQPRNTADLGIQPVTYPFENISRDRTFEVATWNMEFFGYNGPIGTDPDAGPDDEELQIANAVKVLRHLDADLYGLEEIVSTVAFNRVLDSLNLGRPGTFAGQIAPIRQIRSGEDPAEVGQKTAFIWRTATVTPVSRGFFTTSGQWGFCCGSGGGGRYPYALTFDATMGSTTKRITAVVIHAKAGSTTADYDQRQSDVNLMKTTFDGRPNDDFILLGDYNDDLDVSTVGARATPYANYTSDAAWSFPTLSLSQQKFASTTGGEMIDHIGQRGTIASHHLAGTTRIENPNYIGSYLSTTSDHYPVWTRYDFAGVTPNEEIEAPAGTLALAVTPAPARGRVAVRFAALAAPGTVALFDILGRRVADAPVATGAAEAAFDVAALPAGLYVVRLDAGAASASKTLVVVR